MLIGMRNWYTELGVTPVHTGSDAGDEFNFADLAKPWRGAISRSLKQGSVSEPTFGAAGIEVTWPRAVPVRLIGILGMRSQAGDAIDLAWELKNGGSGGTSLAGYVASSVDVSWWAGFPWEDDLANNLIIDLGATYIADYLHFQWYRNSDAIPFDFRGLWASSALELNPDQIEPELLNDSVIESSLAGGDYSIDRRIWRRFRYSGIVSSGGVSPMNDGDTAESWGELLNGAGRSTPVVIHRGGVGLAPKEVAVHGLLAEGSGITKLPGRQHRVTVKVEEL